MSGRTLRRLHRAVSDDIGDLRTQRPLPNEEIDQIDPFLFLNHHGPQVYGPNNHGLPFGPHPHRGFETVTFIVEGSLAHRDSGGHDSIIRAGGVQWMTAGRGLEHAELSPDDFLSSGGPLEILQLWVNLPKRLKMTEPRYVGLSAEQIPTVQGEGAAIHVISGEYDHTRGPVSSPTGITMMTIDLDESAHVVLPAPRDHNVFLYVVRGQISIEGKDVPAMNLAEMNDDGDSVDIAAAQRSLLIFGHARPFGEPVVAHGPFVMNTHEEIIQAIRDYQAGFFR
jgi:redox-sensitive bicupin YhaK (pirin superfamily)